MSLYAQQETAVCRWDYLPDDAKPRTPAARDHQQKEPTMTAAKKPNARNQDHEPALMTADGLTAAGLELAATVERLKQAGVIRPGAPYRGPKRLERKRAVVGY